MTILTHISSWAWFKTFLILLGSACGFAFIGSKLYVRYELKKNIEKVEISTTLEELKTGQDDAAIVANNNTNKIDSVLLILTQVQSQGESNKIAITTLKTSYSEYIKKDASIPVGDLIEILEDLWGVKKNSCLMIDSINYKNITAQGNTKVLRLQ